MHHQRRPDVLPRATDQPPLMVMKFYQHVHNSIRINFYTCHKVWIEVKMLEFSSEACGDQNFDCSILFCSKTNEGETGGVAFVVRRATKFNRWSRLNWPESSPVSNGSFCNFLVFFSCRFLLLHLNSWLERRRLEMAGLPRKWSEKNQQRVREGDRIARDGRGERK